MDIGFWWVSQKEKRPQGRSRRKWMNNIKMNLKGIGRGGMDYIDLVLDRDQWKFLVNTIINIRVP
jgi:hypothetical protein